jgi:hypothetical protein
VVIDVRVADYRLSDQAVRLVERSPTETACDA